MSSVPETFRAVNGLPLSYPPPGRLGNNGAHFPNPFLSLHPPQNNQIYRSFGVVFEEAYNGDVGQNEVYVAPPAPCGSPAAK
jgi:hypothetical protein